MIAAAMRGVGSSHSIPQQSIPGIGLPKRVEEMIEELANVIRVSNMERLLFLGQLEHEHEAIAAIEGIPLP